MYKNNFKNILFKLFIFTFLIIFVMFILITIAVVIQKGIPSLLEVIMDNEIQYAIKMTMYTSSVSTVLCLIFSIPISYGLARYNFYGKRIVNSILQVPNSIPPIASGIALLLLFSTEWMEKIVSNLGVDPVFSVKGIILAQFFVNTPYMIRILKTTFEEINPKFEFVARMLGCNCWGIFFKVMLPIAKNGLISSIIITWTNALGEFGTALMIAGAIRMKTETLPAAIFLNVSEGNLDKALAASTILIIISVVCLFILESIGIGKYKKNNC